MLLVYDSNFQRLGRMASALEHSVIQSYLVALAVSVILDTRSALDLATHATTHPVNHFNIT